MKVRQRAKVDDNQAQLVKVIKKCGASWLDLSRMGGALDGIIGYAGIDVRVEIKDGAKPASARRLTTAESKVFRTWRGRKPVILTCEDDVLSLIALLREEANQWHQLRSYRN